MHITAAYVIFSQRRCHLYRHLRHLYRHLRQYFLRIYVSIFYADVHFMNVYVVKKDVDDNHTDVYVILTT